MMFLLVLLAASHGAFGGEWKASVVQNIDALVSSCVVLPCSFSHPKEPLPTSRLRGIWHRENQKDQRIYHKDNTMVLENFRDRTRLLGQLGQGNCSLEITPIQDYDNGPFCFRIELARTEDDAPTPDKFSFQEDCVTLKMLPDPPKPTLSHGNAAIQGRPYVVSCSVRHTCPTHAPTLTWSRGTSLDVTTINREVHLGFWEVQSILTIVPEATDDHTDVTCTAIFYSRRTTSDTFTLFVKLICPRRGADLDAHLLTISTPVYRHVTVSLASPVIVSCTSHVHVPASFHQSRQRKLRPHHHSYNTCAWDHSDLRRSLHADGETIQETHCRTSKPGQRVESAIQVVSQDSVYTFATSQC
ncbi:myelin-associated glycoprotein isoform X4 [Nerophis lumbriciformis]|uniref:myelin-associated glycoprotein isoform X4 n=1 Tax=Nerophis lumbriciformis TaxID=546530 RepID=UPI003BA9AE0E